MVSLISGVSSAQITREYSYKSQEAKGNSLTQYEPGPKNRDQMDEKKPAFSYCGGENS